MEREQKLAQVQAKLKRWQSRLSRAATEIAKLQRQERYYSRPAKSAVTEITDLRIPDALRRDKQVADQIKSEIEEQKKLKARGRIAKMKAKRTGDLKKMPLEGKAALRYIHGV